MVNTERCARINYDRDYYNILNIVVNTEPFLFYTQEIWNYNILNIVVNTEQKTLYITYKMIITY